MRFTDFSNEFLVAAYQAAENANERRVISADILDNFALRWKEGWVHNVIADLGGRALIYGKGVDADERSQPVTLTAAGLREAERLIDNGVSVFKLESPEPAKGVGYDNAITTKTSIDIQQNKNDDSFAWTDVNPALYSTSIIDSSKWTGIEKRFAANPVLIEQISVKINEIDDLVEKSNLTNSERQKAKAITAALNSLVSSPEPEWQAIVTLLNSPTLNAVLNVAAVIQIIFSIVFGN